MAVISVDEVGTDRGAGQEGQVRTNKRNFIVVLSDATDDPTEALNAPGIPLDNSPHPFDSQSFVVGKDTEETDSREIWFIIVRYSTEGTDDPDFPGTGGDPLAENPRMLWTTRDIEVVAVAGRKISPGTPSTVEVPITNSTGDLYTDPALVIPDFLQVYTLTRNERPTRDYNPNVVRRFNNSINKTRVVIGGQTMLPRTAWLIKYEGGEIQQREGTNFVAVTYQIMMAREGFTWLDSILDQGLREFLFTAEGIKRVAILDEAGKKITTPVNLDGEGSQLAVGEDPVFLEYLTKGESNFSTLRLPRKYSLTGV